MPKSKAPHVAAAEKYVRDVLAGRIDACKWVRLACERHRDDKRRSRTDKSWQYKFVPEKAERVAVFCEGFPHTKGRWAAKGEPFVLEPWQCFLIASVFGWVTRKGGLRRFRRALLLVPRKNGKSDLAARIGLYMLVEDNEYAAEVFSGATSEKQAFEVFRPAHRMARFPAFLEYYDVQVPESERSRLVVPEDGSFFSTLIGKPGDGASPSCAITDEYHEHATDEQLDTMETGMGAREQPLSLIITTAGDNLNGPCHALQKDLEKILGSAIEDDTFWGINYTIDDADDPFTEASLRKANPNFDVSVSGVFLLSQLNEAKRESRKQGVYQTKHLNVWVGARAAYFNVRSWEACPERDPESLKGRTLYLGMDLASKKDIASLVALADLGDGEFACFGKHYVPQQTVEGEANAQYAGWAKDGWLIATDGIGGTMIDHSRIEEDILALHDEYGLAGVAYDPAQANLLVANLLNAGIRCVEVRPVVLNFSEPMKLLERLIVAGRLAHEHNPAMRWMMSNVVSKPDRKDNDYPNKEKPESKIDGAVALIMAKRLWTLMGAEDPELEFSLHFF